MLSRFTVGKTLTSMPNSTMRASAAHVAELLGQHEVGTESFEPFRGEYVEALVPTQPGGHRVVDLDAGQALAVDSPGCQHRLALHLGRIVALVGHSDETVTQAHGAHNLRGAWKQRCDLHGSPVRHFPSRLRTASLRGANPRDDSPSPRTSTRIGSRRGSADASH